MLHAMGSCARVFGARQPIKHSVADTTPFTFHLSLFTLFGALPTITYFYLYLPITTYKFARRG